MVDKVNNPAPGFMLFQTVIALFLLGSLTVLMATSYSRCITLQKRATTLMQAVVLARQALLCTSAPKQSTVGNFTLEQTLEPGPLPSFVWHVCKVSWHIGDQPESITLKKGTIL